MASPCKKICLLSRFRGCLVGAVMGDCLGAPFEDLEPPVSWNLLSNYVQKFESDGYTGQINFTDDTAMARSIAVSLAQNKALDAHDLAKRFTAEYFADPEDRGYGIHVRKVFHTLKASNYADVFKPASEQFNGTGSYGNGGGMRIAPAALFGYNMKSFSELKPVVEDITKLTHTHKHGILGALLQCYAVRLALKHDHDAELDPEALLADLSQEMETLEKSSEYAEEENLGDTPPKRRPNRPSENVSEPYTHKLTLMKRFLSEDPKIDELVASLGNDISALGSVPVAIYSFLRALKPIEGIQEEDPFKRAILYAILMGGDTDTIATMTGAIAGAYHGLEAIPQIWQERCEGVNDALKQADDLYNLLDLPT